MDGQLKLLRLMNFVSPALPIGSFAYSHGVEWAIEAGEITGRTCVEAWISDLLLHGSFQVDLVAVSAAWRADRLEERKRVAEFVLAQASSRERWEETTQQGQAFLRAVENWPIQGDATGQTKNFSCPLPVAFGLTCRDHAFEEGETLLAYAHCASSALLSACVRLVPLGQTDALKVLSALEVTIVNAAAAAQGFPLEDVGSACFASDLAAMLHETQTTRLFRS